MCLHNPRHLRDKWRNSARGQVFLFISVFQPFFKMVVLRAFPVSEAVYTGGLRLVLVRNVLSQAASGQPLTTEARVRSQAYPLWG
jgi:hypothetical protein